MIAFRIPEFNGADNRISVIKAGFLTRIRTNNDIIIYKVR